MTVLYVVIDVVSAVIVGVLLLRVIFPLWRD